MITVHTEPSQTTYTRCEHHLYSVNRRSSGIQIFYTPDDAHCTLLHLLNKVSTLWLPSYVEIFMTKIKLFFRDFQMLFIYFYPNMAHWTTWSKGQPSTPLYLQT